MTFKELYETRVEQCSHETAFSKEEARILYELLQTLPDHSNVVEIGVEFGRSTTIIGHVAKEKNFNFTAIDPFIGEYGNRAKAHVVEKLMFEWKLPVQLKTTTSAAAVLNWPVTDIWIDLIHIDGDHSYEAVALDCELWLPKVVPGRYACFDDYGHTSLPEVFEAVNDYMSKHPEWTLVGHYDGRFGVFKKA